MKKTPNKISVNFDDEEINNQNQKLIRSSTSNRRPINLSSGKNSQNNSIDEVDCLDVEIAVGNETHILTIFQDSDLKELTSQFAEEKGLPKNLE